MILKLSFALFILMIIVGGDRGVRSFCTLLINIVIGSISVYLITIGIHPLPVMLISSLLFCLTTILLQNGLSRKTMAALIAVAIIISLSSLLIYFFCMRAHIVGFNEIELQEEDIAYLSAAVDIRMGYVLLTALIWGQLGAIIDTSIAIASPLSEIHRHNPDFPPARLFQEGLIIGKDILGTTVNTLTFVFLGESIMLFIYYVTYQYSFQSIFNSSSFYQTILPVLLPCIGCIAIIPLTSWCYIQLLLRAKNQ